MEALPVNGHGFIYKMCPLVKFNAFLREKLIYFPPENENCFPCNIVMFSCIYSLQNIYYYLLCNANISKKSLFFNFHYK